jgi:hypothetical protein
MGSLVYGSLNTLKAVKVEFSPPKIKTAMAFRESASRA